MSMYPLLTIGQIRQQHAGRMVRVYISDNVGRWAIQDYDTKKLIFNANLLTLNGVTTYVNEAKRLTCVKHVRLTHAYVVGTIGIQDTPYDACVRKIDYDPHRFSYFYYADDESEFVKADYAICARRNVYVSC